MERRAGGGRDIGLNNPVGDNRQLPEGVIIKMQRRSEEALEDTNWQEEPRLLVTEQLYLNAEEGGRVCGSLRATLKIDKEPEGDGFTEKDRYVYLSRIDVHGKRKQGIGTSLLSEMERHAAQFGASRIEGIISPIDLEETPQLPEFYAQRGYQVIAKGRGFKLAKPLR